MIKDLVSVVISIHNEPADYLRTAIESIFNQTYPNIEIILIDDASNNECKILLSDICKGKNNVRILHNETNLGLTKSLNIGLEAANGEYIARMDADDISLPHRIEKQVDFLMANGDADIVGTGVVSFGDSSGFMSPANGYSNSDVQCNLFFSSSLCHPSVMIRKQFLDKNNLQYDEKVKKGQDYDLWERASVCGKLAVMSEVLLYYRAHSNQITATNRKDQDLTSELVQKRRLQRIGIVPSENEMRCHVLLAKGVDSSVSIEEMQGWVDKLIIQNYKIGLVDDNEFRLDLRERMTLYKMRNNAPISSFGFRDASNLMRIFCKRFAAKIKLINIQRQIRIYLRQINEEQIHS